MILFIFQLIQWSLSKFGEMLFDLPIHVGACGPFVRSEPGGFRQVQTPKGKLFDLDSEGRHLLTCAINGGLLYQVGYCIFIVRFFITKLV